MISILTGSTLVDVIAISVTLIAVAYTYFKWNYQYWKRRNVPYFEPIFPFGNRNPVGNTMSQGDDIFNAVNKAKAKGWKCFGMFLGLNPVFVTHDVEMVRCILSKDFNYFTERGLYYNERDDPISANLLNLGGSKWKNLRVKLTPTFTSGKIKGMFQTLVNCSFSFEEALKKHNTKEPIDIKHFLNCFTMDVIGSCGFGLECNCFNEPDSPFIKYGKRSFYRNSYERIVELFAMSFPRLAYMLHVKTLPTEISKFYSEIVKGTVSFRESRKIVRKDFLQLLIDIKNEGGENSLTIEEIVAQCFVFFMAGFEGSSAAVTFALFELSQHPEIQEKVREELFRVLEKYDNKLCYDAVEELVYMQQVIDESLRKYSPDQFITRQAVKDYKLPGSDFIVEKGRNIIIAIKNLHYDENVYDDPERFDPDRFSPEQKKTRSPYSHIPFGGGPRMCIGMRFGLIQSKVAFATVLRNFRCSLNEKTVVPLEMDPTSDVTATKDVIWLNLEPLNK